MLYQSTRGGAQGLTSAEIIVRGLSENGGLFAPETFPAITREELSALSSKPYYKRAAYIIGRFLDDFSAEELDRYAYEAYRAPCFDNISIAPVHKLDGNTHFLELWHGPTCAFKDMALQMLPRLLASSLNKTGERREACMLVATSGDTGKAALEGFRDVPGTNIMVFYPRDGVSDIQELQMTSQGGGNVNVVAVEGNFDDTQTGVKDIFSDEELRSELGGRGYFLSSANSINWGRLVPQIAYYISAYCDLLSTGEIKSGDRINFCVPTGNFGNILAAYYAEKMGLPINKLICASNRNDVLTQFIDTGVYDKNRPFYTTISPSMDILISSNLERLLFEMSGKDGGAVAGYMAALSDTGRYIVPQSVRDEIGRVFTGGLCMEEDTLRAIAGVFNEYGYLIDTHTAVGYKVLCDYRAASGDRAVSIVVSTASAFKFSNSVIEALGLPRGALNGIGLMDLLADISGCEIPAPLAGLREAVPRFSGSVAQEGMKAAVKDYLCSRPRV